MVQLRSRALASLAAAALLATLATAALALMATPAHAATPVATPAFTQVDAGDGFAVGLTEGGSVYVWGTNTAVAPTTAPTLMRLDPGGMLADQVAAGDDFIVVLDRLGEVWTWGSDAEGQLGFADASHDGSVPAPLGMDAYLAGGDTVVQVAAGARHALALTQDGQLFAWGDNAQGQVSYGNAATTIQTPTEFNTPDDEWPEHPAFQLIGAGDVTSYAVIDGLWGYAWGGGDNFELGVNWDPGNGQGWLEFVGGDVTAKITDIDGGTGYAMALTDAGEIYMWGRPGDHVFGNDTYNREHPFFTALPNGAANVTAIAAGAQTVYAVTDDGTVWSWGADGTGTEAGALGRPVGTGPSANLPAPITQWPAVHGDATAVAVGAGRYIGGAITSSGGLYTWGAEGSRGDGSTANTAVPVNAQVSPTDTGTATIDGDLVQGSTVTAQPSGWPANAVITIEWTEGSGWVEGPSHTLSGTNVTLCMTALAENHSVSGQYCQSPYVQGPPVISTESLPGGTAGVPYSASLSYSYPGYTRVFSISSGNFPDCLSLDTEDGLFYGTCTAAGDYTFTVQLTAGTVSTTKEFTITIAPAATESIALNLSAATVDQGGSLTFTVTGEDEFGNSTGDLTADAIVSSDVDTDVISGGTITFPHASPHTITAEYGQLRTFVVVEVNPADAGAGDPDDDSLSDTGFDQGWLALAAATLLVAGAVAISVGARRLRLK